MGRLWLPKTGGEQCAKSFAKAVIPKKLSPVELCANAGTQERWHADLDCPTGRSQEARAENVVDPEELFKHVKDAIRCKKAARALLRDIIQIITGRGAPMHRSTNFQKRKGWKKRKGKG